jgi:membrane associated rhomboid family serine protease
VLAQHADGIYFLYGFVPARYSTAFLAHHGINPGSIFDRAIPFVSYIFLHGGWTHVIINSIWLLAFGPVVARRFGTPLFLGFFLICGIAGAATHLALHWGSTEPVIGASAGISGVMAAAFRMLPFGPQDSEQPVTPLFSGRILLWSAIVVVINIVAGVTGLGTGQGPNEVAWQAHIGGYFAGLVLTWPFYYLARR